MNYQKFLDHTQTLGRQYEPMAFRLLYHCQDTQRWPDKNIVKTMRGRASNPANILSYNPKLMGLWTSCTPWPDSNKLPTISPFGDTRYSIHAAKILDFWSVNLYYADHYCTGPCHYVTIVVTKKGSDKDK
jgi:hypothetical protein